MARYAAPNDKLEQAVSSREVYSVALVLVAQTG